MYGFKVTYLVAIMALNTVTLPKQKLKFQNTNE